MQLCELVTFDFLEIKLQEKNIVIKNKKKGLCFWFSISFNNKYDFDVNFIVYFFIIKNR